MGADELYRELKFSMMVDSSILPGIGPGEETLLQGVIDCCIAEGDSLTVVDYKTDYFESSMAEEKKARYKGQLDAYAMALERMFGKPVKSKILYFLNAGIQLEVE